MTLGANRSFTRLSLRAPSVIPSFTLHFPFLRSLIAWPESKGSQAMGASKKRNSEGNVKGIQDRRESEGCVN